MIMNAIWPFESGCDASGYKRRPTQYKGADRRIHMSPAPPVAKATTPAPMPIQSDSPPEITAALRVLDHAVTASIARACLPAALNPNDKMTR